MPQWTPKQLLAVHEFCQILADTIWQKHGDKLIHHIRQEEDKLYAPRAAPVYNVNLELPFMDETAF